MRILTVVFLLLASLAAHAQAPDSTKIDNGIVLNPYESGFLNEYLQQERDTFDFSNKKILFVTGSSNHLVVNKKDYFKSIIRNKSVPTSIIVLNPAEKVQSGGCEAIVVYWSKAVPNKQKILKKLKKR